MPHLAFSLYISPLNCSLNLQYCLLFSVFFKFLSWESNRPRLAISSRPYIPIILPDYQTNLLILPKKPNGDSLPHSSGFSLSSSSLTSNVPISLHTPSVQFSFCSKQRAMMICTAHPTSMLKAPFFKITPKPKTRPPLLQLQLHLPNSSSSNQEHRKKPPFTKTHAPKPLLNPTQKPKSNLSFVTTKKGRGGGSGCSTGYVVEDQSQVWALCGFGYWVQGFRCFPWLALNFHMAHGLGLSPSVLQLVQHTANLPMVAKPLFGVLSDAVYIGGAHRIPYISIGVFLQAVSWGTLALVPGTRGTFPTQMGCILLGNVGASVTEVVSDALVAEFSKTQKAGVLQSYAFIALAAGAMLGNLSGGFILLQCQDPKTMFFIFALLLTFQLALSSTTKEALLQCPNPVRGSISENISKQFSDVITAISDERIVYPLSWFVVSTAFVPLLSGSMFCYQTQCLKLDPSIIGLAKVVGQLMVLSAAVFYNRYLKRIPMRRLIWGVQILYALSFLSDLLLLKQINVKWGISNEVYMLCFSSLAEAVAQFKSLPFSVLFSSLCPPGCEGSLFAFFASALCLSSIVSGILGVGLASLIGVSSGDYSSLHLGIMVQFIAALVPLGWISYVPLKDMEKKRYRAA